MSEIKYGLISRTDANAIEKTIDLICEAFPNEVVNVTEIGLYSGQSSEAISKYISLVKHRVFFYTGIDNGKDGEELKHFPDFNSRLILGNSNEVYNQIPDNSQHLIFVDSLHTFPGVVSDFFCYAPKVKPGGFITFHDCGKHIDPLSGWQGVGDKNDPDMCLGGVRKALQAIGLFGRKSGFIIDMEELRKIEYLVDDIERVFNQQGTLIAGAKRLEDNSFPGWDLVFDEADPNDTAGGICCFCRLY